MVRGTNISATELLDEGCRVVRKVPPLWLGLLWLLGIPFRLLLINFYSHAINLEARAVHYGDFLNGLAWLALLAWLPALYGRLVFVRACMLSHEDTARLGLTPLKPRWGEIVIYVSLATLIGSAFYILFMSFVAIPVLIMLAALAPSIAFGHNKPELVNPVKTIGRILTASRGIWYLMLLMAALLLAAWVNLSFAFDWGLNLGSVVTGIDLSAWQHLFRSSSGWPWPPQTLPRMLLFAGATMLVEPIWLAAHAVAVQQFRSTVTGEDLQGWFRSLQKEREAA